MVVLYIGFFLHTFVLETDSGNKAEGSESLFSEDARLIVRSQGETVDVADFSRHSKRSRASNGESGT